jgi:hypothetical protein
VRKFAKFPYESLLVAAGYLKENSGDERVVPRDIETIAVVD